MSDRSPLLLEFEGWAQCRLATDPDPSDEPRGVTGWTFATAGEPDLDRIIRFQPDGACSRRFGPSIGVRVTTARVDKTDVSALIDARVELLGDPVFEGRNGLAYEDVVEPIFPLHIRVRGSGAILERRHADAEGNPLLAPGIGTTPDPALAKRLGVESREDAIRFRADRHRAVEQACQDTADPTEKLSLRLRASWLARVPDPDPDKPLPIHTGILLAGMSWQANLAGHEARADVGGFDGRFDMTSPWPLTLWMGIWDADALCGYVTGRLGVPVLE